MFALTPANFEPSLGSLLVLDLSPGCCAGLIVSIETMHGLKRALSAATSVMATLAFPDAFREGSLVPRLPTVLFAVSKGTPSSVSSAGL